MRAKEHFIIGAAVGLLANAIKQQIQMAGDPSREFNWLELGCWGGVGGVIGLAADMIEPADTPNHRGFFHSVTCGTGLVYATHGPHSEAWDEEPRYAARKACWCYVSHLVADSTTPRGIALF